MYYIEHLLYKSDKALIHLVENRKSGVVQYRLSIPEEKDFALVDVNLHLLIENSDLSIDEIAKIRQQLYLDKQFDKDPFSELG